MSVFGIILMRSVRLKQAIGLLSSIILLLIGIKTGAVAQSQNERIRILFGTEPSAARMAYEERLISALEEKGIEASEALSLSPGQIRATVALGAPAIGFIPFTPDLSQRGAASTFLSTPAAFQNLDHRRTAIRGVIGSLAREEIADTETFALQIWPLAVEAFASGKPINALEDLQGERIATLGNVSESFLASLGASPVVVSTSDLYPSVQAGSVDAVTLDQDLANQPQWLEFLSGGVIVQDYSVRLAVAMVSAEWWRALTAAEQRSILEALDEAELAAAEALHAQTDRLVLSVEERSIENLTWQGFPSVELQDAIGAALVNTVSSSANEVLQLIGFAQSLAPSSHPERDREVPEQPLWGDVNVRTRLSLAAALWGNRLGPKEAFRAARGEQITTSTGQQFRLSRPLDWVVVADVSDLLGFGYDLQSGSPNLLADPIVRNLYESLQAGGEAEETTLFDLITSGGTNNTNALALGAYTPAGDRYRAIWSDALDIAESYNEPGVFSTVLGFGWAAQQSGNTLYRNVIFRDGPDLVRRIVPFTSQPPAGSNDPLSLFEFMEAYEQLTGGSVLAISHGGNRSNGFMFPSELRFDGSPIDQDYVRLRARWEPGYIVTEIFGDSETHPFLSPDDDFADYGTLDLANSNLSELKTEEMLENEYAREALKLGLKLENRFGTNPYKFGFLGATSSYTSLASAEEENFFGLVPTLEPSSGRLTRNLARSELASMPGWTQISGGMTAIYAPENTRGAIWDALARREFYSTTGSRITLRFFGGWDFGEQDLRIGELHLVGYEKGVPMGADLPPLPDDLATPSFLIFAQSDPQGANLDRVQVVKGWLDDEGQTSEKIYDVAWSAERSIDADGKLESVGNTVEPGSASWTNSIGARELVTVWSDPDFDPSEHAFYYVRAIEIPTPPWYVYDEFRLGSEVPGEAARTHQERAYASPIWYTP